MADSLRTNGDRGDDTTPDADRDAKIEELLLAGLDHYFSEQYEQAINIWTRALFFDRSHARARAYIDRARSAQAERQRQSEELLHRGAAALDLGRSDEARRLLDAAVATGAAAVDLQPLLDRLGRETTGHVPILAGPTPRPWTAAGVGSATRIAGTKSRRRVGFGVGVAVLGLAVVIAAAYSAAMRADFDVRAWLMPLLAPEQPAAAITAPAARANTLPLPTRGEIELGRARTLATRGRLHEALAALDGVRITDPQKADADRLRADIQRQLLAIAGR